MNKSPESKVKITQILWPVSSSKSGKKLGLSQVITIQRGILGITCFVSWDKISL